MALEKKVQTIAFSSSVKEQVDPLLVPNGALLNIENGVFDVDGRIRKRYGFARLTQETLSGQPLYSNVAYENAARLFPHGDEEICLWDEKRVYGYSPTQAKWALKSEHGSLMAERMGFLKDMGHLVVAADCAVTSTGMRCVAYMLKDAADPANKEYLYSSLYDETTGSAVSLHKRIDGSVDCGRCRLIVVDDGTTEWFVVVYWRGDVGTEGFYVSFLDSADASATWSIGVLLMAPGAGPYTFDFDAVAMTGDVFAFSCYYLDGATNKIFVGDYTHDGTPLASWNAAWTPGASPCTGIALDWDGDPAVPAVADRIHLAYYDDNVVKWKSFSSTLTPDQSATVEGAVDDSGGARNHFRVGVKAIPGQSKVLVLWQECGSGALTTVDPTILKARWVNPVSGALYGSADLVTAHTLMTARPFIVNGMVHVLSSGAMWRDALSLYSYAPRVCEGLFMLRYDPALAAESQLSPRVVCNAALDEGVGMTHACKTLRQVTAYDGRYYTAQAIADTDFSANTDNVFYEVFRFDPTDRMRSKHLTVGGKTLLLGGVPSQYDGDVVSELSFPYGPLVLELDEVGSGNLTKAGNGLYTYRVVFEWYDANGDRIYSESSLDAQITLSATGKNVKVDYRGMPISSKSDWFPSALVQVYASIYRTVEDDEQTFYFVARQALNRFAVDYYEYTDSSTSVEISAHEQLYTNGLELDTTALPSCSVGAVVDGLVWMRSDEKKGELYYSKPLTTGRPVEFNNEFSKITVPFDVYGLAAQSGTCVALGRDSVSIIEGRGPGRTGQGDTFQQRTILSGVGTTQPMSVVETPIGTLFFNGQTWCLLNGKFGLEILGDVDTTMTDFPTIVDVARSDRDNTYRFICYNAAGDDYIVLTFDWQSRNWSKHTPTFMEDLATEVVASSIAQSGTTMYMGAGSFAYEESGYSDSGVYNQEVEPTLGQVAFYPLIIETADLKTGNLNDFKRIWRCILLLRRMGAHGIKLWAAYNGEPGYTLVRTWTTAEITAVGVTERLRYHMKRQKCSTVRYKIEDTDPGTGLGSRGYEALGLTLELGMKSGTLKFQKEST